MQLNDPNDPAWDWLMHTTHLTAALVGLVIFSSTFDETE
jgi:hypothetical protein